jgi:hypothetical protein
MTLPDKPADVLPTAVMGGNVLFVECTFHDEFDIDAP